MARTTTTSEHSFSPSQAVFILERAIADRKLSSADVKVYVASMHDEISTLEARLARLTSAVVQPVRNFVHQAEAAVRELAPSKRGARKRKKAITAERQASMQLQGQYLALLSKLSKKDRVTFKALAKKDGREKAIEAMKKAAG